jgi:hypothetical protein
LDERDRILFTLLRPHLMPHIATPTAARTLQYVAQGDTNTQIARRRPRHGNSAANAQAVSMATIIMIAIRCWIILRLGSLE